MVVPKVHGFWGILLLDFFFSGLGEVVSKNDSHEESSGTKSCSLAPFFVRIAPTNCRVLISRWWFQIFFIRGRFPF